MAVYCTVLYCRKAMRERSEMDPRQSLTHTTLILLVVPVSALHGDAALYELANEAVK